MGNPVCWQLVSFVRASDAILVANGSDLVIIEETPRSGGLASVTATAAM